MILKRSGCLLRSCTASRRLCVSRQFSANLCYDANNAASAAYVGQLRQTKKAVKLGCLCIIIKVSSAAGVKT